MKPYAVPLSLLGAALILAGGLAYVLAEEPGVGILINVVVGGSTLLGAPSWCWASS